MDILVAAVALGMIISKFFDCHSTQKGLDRHPGNHGNAEGELNRWARKLMTAVGENAGIWYVFLFTTGIVALATWLLYVFYPAPVYKILYSATGLLITVVHVAVAYSNYSRRGNVITRLVIKIPIYRNRRI